MKMKIPAPLPLLLCWMLLMDPEMILLGSPETIELNMADEAVDDMFYGCTKEMETKVKEKPFKHDNQKDLERAWKVASKCAKKEHDEDKDLTINHTRAICAYTSYFYKDINNAVRSGKNIYGSTFQYHQFYYWLTTAIQILKKNQPNCHKVYRRETKKFTGEINKVVRFGSFTSTSFRTNKTNFGSETCFYINTCLGAFLKNYPTFNDSEQEVLIPPYEQFKISDIKVGVGKFKDMQDCKKTFILKSEGLLSNVNCRLINN
ncbi:NAD(P)(+)--arginine ADP-ribosyltransferase 2 [Channa argus]|uniref:NAD(P)(+)--arginine ADP-ribosyltransferase n=1 Tax=Channa argus TaxID=215402 RepID=A0A6G1QS79_CHAAH|nr:NAD(P)(+)--arginine ADP-ribosyltransferase 2 [Channa argus]